MEKRNLIILVLVMVFLIIFSFSLIAYPETPVIELCDDVLDHYEYTYDTYYTNHSYTVCDEVPAWNISNMVCETEEFIEKNDSYVCCYNYTDQRRHQEIKEKKPVYRCQRIGYKVGEKEYKGWVNVEGNILSQWSVPIGDRNFDEYGRCREYEIEKGFCKEINLVGVI